MGQVLHESATATEAVLRAIQESLNVLARRHGNRPQDRRQVELLQVGRGPADGAESGTFDGPVA